MRFRTAHKTTSVKRIFLYFPGLRWGIWFRTIAHWRNLAFGSGDKLQNLVWGANCVSCALLYLLYLHVLPVLKGNYFTSSNIEGTCPSHPLATLVPSWNGALFTFVAYLTRNEFWANEGFRKSGRGSSRFIITRIYLIIINNRGELVTVQSLIRLTPFDKHNVCISADKAPLLHNMNASYERGQLLLKRTDISTNSQIILQQNIETWCTFREKSLHKTTKI